jgi:hypothetical protein
MDIVNKISILIGERERSSRMSGKSSADKKSYERKHYRMGKHKKKASKEKTILLKLEEHQLERVKLDIMYRRNYG